MEFYEVCWMKRHFQSENYFVTLLSLFKKEIWAVQLDDLFSSFSSFSSSSFDPWSSSWSLAEAFALDGSTDNSASAQLLPFLKARRISKTWTIVKTVLFENFKNQNEEASIQGRWLTLMFSVIGSRFCTIPSFFARSAQTPGSRFRSTTPPIMYIVPGSIVSSVSSASAVR